MVEARDSNMRVVSWGLPGSQELHLAMSGARVSSRPMPSLPKVSVVARVQEHFHASFVSCIPVHTAWVQSGQATPNTLCTHSCTNLPRGHLPQQGLIQRGPRFTNPADSPRPETSETNLSGSYDDPPQPTQTWKWTRRAWRLKPGARSTSPRVLGL